MKSDTVSIEVRLYKDYRSAKEIYVKRGYIPDGNGITYNYNPVILGVSYQLMMILFCGSQKIYRKI